MKRTPLFTGAAFGAVALLALGTGLARADAGEAGEIAAVASARITPTHAIAIAEGRSHGRAFGMGLEVAKSGTWYEVQLNVKGKPMLARVAPDSGRFLGIAPARGEDADGLHSLDGHPLTLAGAITAAERHAGGRALEAGPYGKGPGAHYDVDVVKAGAVSHWSVNADTGAVTPAPASEQD